MKIFLNPEPVSLRLEKVIDMSKLFTDRTLRDINYQIMNVISAFVPNFVGGSADLVNSTKTYLKNKEDFLKAGNLLLEKTGCEAVLITCGADGMVVIEKNNHYTHIPVFNKAEVFDVTGAGDTVTAVYTLALATGADPAYAAIIGNIAASIVVRQFGCATTTVDEILAAVENL